MRTAYERRNPRHFAYLLIAACLLSLSVEGRANVADEGASPAKIKRRLVESQSLASIGYHAASQTLDIEFRSGALYRYSGVPKAVFKGLLRAESKGRFFSEKIRGKFDFRHLPRQSP